MTLRWFWRVYFAALTLVALGIPGCIFGPAIELALAPVRTAQTITGVERIHVGPVTRLCWVWESVKRRPIISDNMDVFIDTKDDTSVASIFERDTGMPWARSRAVGLGQHFQPYCLDLPPHVGPSDPVRVRQTAFYPGVLGLWSLPVRLPDVVDPPEAKF